MILRKIKMLKVCKIDSISFASYAMKQQVDFLGVHILEEKNIGEHQELINYIKSNGGKPIIVTKIQDEDKIAKLLELYNPAGVQFHFEIQPQLMQLIREKHSNLLLFGVLTNQSKFLDFTLIDTLFDFLIYDTNYHGGTNQINFYDHIGKFPDSLKLKTLLAGGVTSERLVELNSIVSGGYDIQSYFRSDGGLNFRNLDKVCDLIKFPRKNMLSVSLTDISLIEIDQAYSFHKNANLEYHLDFSRGSLYNSFNTIDKSIEEKLQYLSQLPCSIHLFIRDESEIFEKIGKSLERYPLNLTRIFVQYFKGIKPDVFHAFDTQIKVIPTVFFEDIQSYLAQSYDYSFLSIIVPKPENKNEIERFIETYLSNKKAFDDKEIWFDRNLELTYIELLKRRLGEGFNFIIGKSVINNLSQINSIHEHLLK